MPILPIALRKEEIDKGHFLCGQRKWECSIVMQMTMALGLIKPHAQLDYLPPRASLLTSTCDHPNTTKSQKPNIHHTREKLIMRTLLHIVNA